MGSKLQMIKSKNECWMLFPLWILTRTRQKCIKAILIRRSNCKKKKDNLSSPFCELNTVPNDLQSSTLPLS